MSTSAEVVDLEQYFAQLHGFGSIELKYSYNLPEPLYTVSYSPEYLAVIIREELLGAQTYNNVKAYQPSEIYMFDSTGLVSVLPNEGHSNSICFIPDTRQVYINSYATDGKNQLEILDIWGKQMQIFWGRRVDMSPAGRFSYTRVSMESLRPLLIVDGDGNSFKIPTQGDYLARANSDSSIIVANNNTVSLWDINKKFRIWTSYMPDEKYYVDDAFNIQYSNKNDIFLIRDMSGIYCFDFNGNLIWSKAKHDKAMFINSVGLSEQNGNIVVTAITNDKILLDLYMRDGQLLNEIEIPFGASERFAANWGFIVDYSDRIFFFRFIINSSNIKASATAIAILYDDKWHPAIIDGLWYYLPQGEKAGTIIGCRSADNIVRAFRYKAEE
jgi:hypothetical protein